jgi:hypothetical protein
VPVPAGNSADFDFVTSLEDTDFSFLRVSIEHDGIGPQTARLYIDVDGAPTWVCVAAYDFEGTFEREYNLAGGWCPTKVYGYRFRIYNSNYIARAVALSASVSETPR